MSCPAGYAIRDEDGNTEQLSNPAERRGNFEEVEEGFTRECSRKEMGR